MPKIFSPRIYIVQDDATDLTPFSTMTALASDLVSNSFEELEGTVEWDFKPEELGDAVQISTGQTVYTSKTTPIVLKNLQASIANYNTFLASYQNQICCVIAMERIENAAEGRVMQFLNVIANFSLTYESNGVAFFDITLSRKVGIFADVVDVAILPESA